MLDILSRNSALIHTPYYCLLCFVKGLWSCWHTEWWPSECYDTICTHKGQTDPQTNFGRNYIIRFVHPLADIISLLYCCCSKYVYINMNIYCAQVDQGVE